MLFPWSRTVKVISLPCGVTLKRSAGVGNQPRMGETLPAWRQSTVTVDVAGCGGNGASSASAGSRSANRILSTESMAMPRSPVATLRAKKRVLSCGWMATRSMAKVCHRPSIFRQSAMA